MAPKAKKGKRTKAPRKPQPLPRSVQALLKYLGGTDVKLGGAGGGGRPATLAPTSINIAVSQQQAQAQQSVRARVAPKGQPIGQSPLAGIIPQQPVIVQQPPASTAETERKFQAQARESEVKQNEINRKFGLLEADARQFRQAAATAYQDIKGDLNRRLAGDVNIFDARNIAGRFSAGTTPRPVVEEPQFQGMSFGARAGGGPARQSVTAEGITVTEVFSGAREEEESSGLAEYLGGQYIQNVSDPEMTRIVRPRGRPRKPEAEKAVKAPRAKKATTKMPAADVSSLLEQRTPATIAGFNPRPVDDPSALFKNPTRTILVKKKVTPSTAAPDMATQIALMTGGGAAAPPQSQGRTVADLLGMTKR